MDGLPEGGAMVAMEADEDRVRPLLGDGVAPAAEPVGSGCHTRSTRR